MAEIKEKFYAKSGNFEPDKCNAYSVISRVDYEAIMQRIIQLQDKTIKKEKRDYLNYLRFVKCGCTKGCQKRSCNCYKNNVKCNNKCHTKMSTCDNKTE